MSFHCNTSAGTHHGRELAFIAIMVTAALMLVSPDSYLHDLFNRVDSAWFYMCGKAWMNGMTPYVDFTDSKGPLLWLIYGIAYLISPRDYIGVFWLSCLSYTVALWLIYRSALLLTGTRRGAMLCAVLMLPAYFYPYIHEEIKTEDFAQPLIAMCLYGTTVLTQTRKVSRLMVRRLLPAMGACIACLLMMKYSLAAMTSVFAVIVVPAAPRHGVGRAKAVLWGVMGFVAALVPWALYFAIAGNFTAFVNEYFVNTLGTLHYLREQNGTIIDILRKFRLHHVVTLFPLLCVGGAVLHARVFKHQWWALAATLWFFVCTIPNAWWLYYYNSCTWTLYYGITAAVTIYCRKQGIPSLKGVMAIAAVAVVAAGAWSIAITPQNFFFAHDREAGNTYYRYVYLMQQVEHPRVVYWDIYSTGFETAAMGLPGCKYWAGQNGATPAMRRAQEDAVRNGDIDFVLVADTAHHAKLMEWGYHVWDYNHRNRTHHCDDLLYTLYTRHTLEAPPEHFISPEPHEILLKKWHLMRQW